MAPLDGSTKGKLVGPDPSQCTGAAWSPDGKSMYFSADAGNGSHLWRQRFPDGKAEQITFGTEEEEAVFVAPDGRSLLTSIGSFQNKIWIHDSRGDRQITSEAYSLIPSFSADGKNLYYIVRSGGGVLAAYGGLWMLDLESGQRQRLLPEFRMSQYRVSRDGKRIVFTVPKAAGRQGLWLAKLDGSSAPRQFTSNPSDGGYFGANGEIFYSTFEQGAANAGSLYRVKEDGGERQKVTSDPVYMTSDVSPDGKYVAVSVPAGAQETGSGATVVYPAAGGAPVTVCICGNRGPDAPHPVAWSPDEKLLYVSLVGGQSVYSIPLRPGQALPPLPPKGIQSAEDILRIPGARLLPAQGEFPGPDPSVYIYPKFTSQRNIFRIPLE